MKENNSHLLWCALITAVTLFSNPLAAAPAKKAAPSEQTVILCLGDSLTEGYGVPQESSWPALLQIHLEKSGKSVRVINSGISGSTSASGPSRLMWYLKGEKPQIMILALGANDGLRGQEVAGMKSNLANTIKIAKEAGIKTVLAGMKIPPNYGQDYANAFEKTFIDLAKELKVELIPFLLEGVAANKDLNLPDGIHPNPKGYEIVIKNVLKTIEPMLKDK